MNLKYKRRWTVSTNRYGRLLSLLQGAGGGVVTYRVIYAVVWDGVPPPAGESTVDSYARHARLAGYGVVRHRGVGLRYDPSTAGYRHSEEPRGWAPEAVVRDFEHA